jgi:molybdopterin-guanine dinucleotide biosynthesis protein A
LEVVPECVERVADVAGVSGPLAGILAALRWEPGACWVIAACDLPLIRGEAVDWLLGERAEGRVAVLPKLGDGRADSLLAVYEAEAVGLIEGLIAEGIRSPHRLAGRAGVHTPRPPEGLSACWTNVNTPEDLDRLGGN